jgi:hypothetical protein
MTLALDSLEQRHLLKNTVSALACKKKMHLGEFFRVDNRTSVLLACRYLARKYPVVVVVSLQRASHTVPAKLFRVLLPVLNSRII